MHHTFRQKKVLKLHRDAVNTAVLFWSFYHTVPVVVSEMYLRNDTALVTKYQTKPTNDSSQS